ncbi:MAG: hypothetical protein HY262_08675 [Chloroflexi bacterium]|nr:hypothetical protein [Chloroflexota bacterium]
MSRTLAAALLLVVLLSGCRASESTDHTPSADPSPSPAGDGASPAESSGPAAWGGREGESFLRPADGLQFVPDDTP